MAETDQYEDAFSNPLRLAYYVIYPVGFTAEWLVMRPLHYLVSRAVSRPCVRLQADR